MTIVVPDKGWRSELADLAPRYLAALNRISPLKIELLVFITQEDFEARTRSK